MHLDRRTHRGDPPAWLPTFWSKPGIYPLSPESVKIIQMVSSLPFDRHATTTTSSAPSSHASASLMASGGPSIFSSNIQPNMLGGVSMGGNLRTMMTETPQSLPPMANMMPALFQQQQYQRMLQYQQQQQQQQQQLQAMPAFSPITSLTSPSLYTQRKPIAHQTLTGATIPQLQFTSSFSSPSPIQIRSQIAKVKSKNAQSPSPSPSTSISNPSVSPALNSVPPKIQRKRVQSLTEKRRVRFTEDQPQVNIFEPELDYVDDDLDPIYQQQRASVSARRFIGDDHNEYYDIDDDDIPYGAYEDYDEYDYDQRHYPDHDYYNSPTDKNNIDYDDNFGAYSIYPNNSMPRTPGLSPRRRQHQIQSYRHHMYGDDDYNFVDGHVGDMAEYDMDYRNDDYYDNYDDTVDHLEDDYYWEDTYDLRQPRSSMDYEKTYQPTFYSSPPSSSQHRRHHSARKSPSSFGGDIQDSPPQQQQHHSPKDRRPPHSTANSRMWQPSRRNHLQKQQQQQQDGSTIKSSSTAGAATSQ